MRENPKAAQAAGGELLVFRRASGANSVETPVSAEGLAAF